MKPLLPLVLSAGLLCGCPDTKIPKSPPKIPEPKAALSLLKATSPNSGALGATVLSGLADT